MTSGKNNRKQGSSRQVSEGLNRGFLDNILNGFSDSVFVIDRNYRVLEVNDKGLERYHLTQQEALKKHCYEVSHHRDSPCDDENHPCPLTTVFDTSKPLTAEHIRHDGEGNELVVVLHAFPLFDDAGKVTAVVEFSQDVTDRKKKEEKLKQSELELAAIFDNSPLMMMLLDEETNIVRINKVAKATTGLTSEEIIGMRGGEAMRCIHHLDVPEGCGFGTFCQSCGIRNTVLDTLQTGTPHHQVEAEIFTAKDDKEIPLNFLVSSTILAINKKRMVLVTLQDITEQKHAVKAQEQMYQLLLEERNMFLSGSVVIFKWRNEEGWSVEYVSENVEGIFGYLASDWTSGKISYADILHQDDVERIGSEVRHFSESGVSKFEHEPYRIIRKDGKTVWLTDHTTILRNEAGDISHYLGYVVDITQRKQLEVKLRKSKERYRSIWKNSPVGIALTDREARFTMANPAFCQILGYQEGELHGRPLFELLAEEDDKLFNSALDTEIHEELANLYSGHPTELTFLKKNGKSVIVNLRIDFITDKNGSLAYMIVQITDITERRLTQRAIERAKQQWENTFDTVPDQIMILNKDCVVERVNRSCSAYFNLEPAEMIGSRCDKWCHSVMGVVGDTCPHEATLRTNQVQHVEYHNPDDNKFFHTIITPLMNENSEAIGVVHVTRDITQMKNAEKVLRETHEVQQRQAMFRQIEQIFSAIRHEIGNALNTLKTTLNVLYTNIDRFPVKKRDIYFQRALDTFGSAERMLRVLKEYQRFDELHLEKLHLDRFITEKIGILIDNAKSAGVRMNYQPGSHDENTKVDRDALMRIILNLVDNAIHATRDLVNPTITISTHRDREWLYLRVSDNGVGITEEEQYKVFAPLYTTRRDGSGLGLAIVQKLMQQMGGAVRLESTLGKGAKFELRLPPA